MTPTTQRHTHALPQELDVPAEPEDAWVRRGMCTMVLRAGLAALALTVAVSGGAYAAVQVDERGWASGVNASMARKSFRVWSPSPFSAIAAKAVRLSWLMSRSTRLSK